MPIQLENINNSKALPEIVLFVNALSRLSSKKEIIVSLLDTISSLIPVKFLSFVEKTQDELHVLYQLGDSGYVKNIFSNDMCKQIFEWVSSQKELASLKIAQKEQFLFIPLVDFENKKEINHGMIVVQLLHAGSLLNKELNMTLNTLSKMSAVSLSGFIRTDEVNRYHKLEERIDEELQVTAKLQKSMSGIETSKKILFNVLEDKTSPFSGNLWWINELGGDIALVLIAQVGVCHGASKWSKGIPSAMLTGYILGEMNSLKNRAEICLKPQEVLKYLNIQLNQIFKDSGITVNAWYGVFDISGKKVRFANANHPDPYVIGPEQQVTSLISTSKEKALGISLTSTYTEVSSYISSGSKLIICTNDLLEQAAKIGHSYDPTWLPQVLETLGSLSLAEMQKSLKSILSENSTGTAQEASRLALLLEIPA